MNERMRIAITALLSTVALLLSMTCASGNECETGGTECETGGTESPREEDTAQASADSEGVGLGVK